MEIAIRIYADFSIPHTLDLPYQVQLRTTNTSEGQGHAMIPHNQWHTVPRFAPTRPTRQASKELVRNHGPSTTLDQGVTQIYPKEERTQLNSESRWQVPAFSTANSVYRWLQGVGD